MAVHDCVVLMRQEVSSREVQHIRERREDKDLADGKLNRVVRILGRDPRNFVQKEAEKRKYPEGDREIVCSRLPGDSQALVVLGCLAEVRSLLGYASLSRDLSRFVQHCLGVFACTLQLLDDLVCLISNVLQGCSRVPIELLEVRRAVERIRHKRVQSRERGLVRRLYPFDKALTNIVRIVLAGLELEYAI